MKMSKSSNGRGRQDKSFNNNNINSRNNNNLIVEEKRSVFERLGHRRDKLSSSNYSSSLDHQHQQHLHQQSSSYDSNLRSKEGHQDQYNERENKRRDREEDDRRQNKKLKRPVDNNDLRKNSHERDYRGDVGDLKVKNYSKNYSSSYNNDIGGSGEMMEREDKYKKDRSSRKEGGGSKGNKNFNTFSKRDKNMTSSVGESGGGGTTSKLLKTKCSSISTEEGEEDSTSGETSSSSSTQSTTTSSSGGSSTSGTISSSDSDDSSVPSVKIKPEKKVKKSKRTGEKLGNKTKKKLKLNKSSKGLKKEQKIKSNKVNSPLSKNKKKSDNSSNRSNYSSTDRMYGGGGKLVTNMNSPTNKNYSSSKSSNFREIDPPHQHHHQQQHHMQSYEESQSHKRTAPNFKLERGNYDPNVKRFGNEYPRGSSGKDSYYPPSEESGGGGGGGGMEGRKRKYSNDGAYNDNIVGNKKIALDRLDSHGILPSLDKSRRTPPSRIMGNDFSIPNKMKRENQSPLPLFKDLPRRSSLEENRRLDMRPSNDHYGSKRIVPPSSNTLLRSKDYEQRDQRDRHYSQNQYNSDRYDKQAYNNRDPQSRDRIAPMNNKNPPKIGMRGGVISGNNKVGDRLNNRDTSKIPSLLSQQFPPERNMYHNRSNYVENERPNKLLESPSKRKPQSPLIVKTKEALMEKYEEMNKKSRDFLQSRVDLWVDETIKGRDIEPPEIAKKVFEENLTSFEFKEKCSSSIESVPDDKQQSTPIKTPVKDISQADDNLSEISDDEILVQVTEERTNNNADEIRTERISTDEFANSEDTSIKTKCEDHLTSVINPQLIPSGDLRSVQSQSQSDDDILESMDFEEISDEEFNEGFGGADNVEKIGIADAIIEWSSLVCREKSDSSSVTSALCRLRERWNMIQIFKQAGLSENLCGSELYNQVLSKIRESQLAQNQTQNLNEKPNDTNNSNNNTSTFNKSEIEYELRTEAEKPIEIYKRYERKYLLENYGVGPYSRALSAKRDVAIRRYLLKMPPKSLISLDLFQQPNSSTSNSNEFETNLDLYRTSVTLFKNQQE